VNTYILRTLEQTNDGTFGELLTEGGWKIALTLEEPWRENQRGKSCIPAGTYKMFKRLSPARGIFVWELKDVPGRSNIQIHVGNFLTDTEGCILVGFQHSDPGAPPSIHDSKRAFRSWMGITEPEDDAVLEVVR
jgi:hypothetical protein